MKIPVWGWFLIAAVIILIIVVIYFATRKPQVSQPVNTPQPNVLGSVASVLSGLPIGNWLSNLFGGGSNMANPACQSSNPGFDNNGFYTTACGGVAGGGGSNCDPSNPGKDMNGFLATGCGS